MRRQTAGGRLDLVGRDMASDRRALGRRPRVSPALLAVVLVAALALAALRIDLIRVRYGLADALSQEKALLEQRREALAQLRTLRDPARLARVARDYGLRRPARIIELPLLPAVAAAPAEETRASEPVSKSPGEEPPAPDPALAANAAGTREAAR